MPEDVVAALRQHTLRLEGVEERTSTYGEYPALFVGRIEFLHFHGPDAFDLRLPPPLVGVEVAKGGTRHHADEAAARDGWVVVPVRAAGDLERAKDLIARGHAGAAKLAGT